MLLTDELIDDLHRFRLEMMARSTKALQAVKPDAAGQEIGGGFANFAGDGSPVTQAYGLGHRGATFDLAELDEFYAGKTDNWELIVTPFASPAVFRRAMEAGYIPDHFESVLGQIAEPVAVDPVEGMEIEEVSGNLTLWMLVSNAAWSEAEELADEPSELSKVMAVYPARRYLAWLDGQPAATTSLIEVDGKFLFAGAATRPQFRNRGLQRALTQRRLADAGAGSFVQVVALPGSQSHRNLQRVGFKPLYSKLVMFRKQPHGS